MKREEIDARLFDLIGRHSFEELTAEERAFVVQHMTKEEFELQRSVISAAESLDFPEPEPLPLQPSEPKVLWYKRSIPLYQAVSVAAALIIFVWVMRSPGSPNLEPGKAENNRAPAVSQTIYDTVIREVPVIQTAIRYIHDTVRLMQRESLSGEPDRPIKASREFNPVALTESVSGNVISMKDDKAIALLTHSISSDRMGAR